MADHPITQYIQEARQYGLTNDQIVQRLTEAGWHVNEILDVVLEHPLVVTPAAGAESPAASSGTASRTADSIISVRGITKIYDNKFKALDNVSLEVQRGRVTALLGPNGAGKTTLVRILTTLLNLTSGSATVAGFDVTRQAQELRHVIGLTGQYAAVDGILTGRENLEMVGRLYHVPKRESKARAAELLKQFDLEDAADRLAKTYSGGMARRLDLASSLFLKPKVLFLDEPTTGLDPRSRFAVWNVIRDLVADGTTVLLTTQYLEEADQLANYIFVIDHGHIIAQGTADDLKSQVGGDVVELHVTNHQQAAVAAAAIQAFGSGEPQVDSGSGVVTMPTGGGATVLLDVVRQLDAKQVKINDILLRRPSLDDVFMKLTGRSTEEDK